MVGSVPIISTGPPRMPPPIASGGPCDLLLFQVLGQRIVPEAKRPARRGRLRVAALANRSPHLDRRRLLARDGEYAALAA
jgi:hypothetical protein